MKISLHYFEYSEWRLMSSGGKIVLDSNIQELRISRFSYSSESTQILRPLPTLSQSAPCLSNK